jgi:1-deoxy-D-xylulose-5-phosphate reductoisomerase
VLSGANEIAVAAFLDGRIPWLGIAEVVAAALDAGTGNVRDVGDVLDWDRVARERAREAVDRIEARSAA